MKIRVTRKAYFADRKARMESNMPAAAAQHPGGMAATFSPNVNMMQFLDWLHAHFSTGGAYFGTSGASIAL